MAFDSTTSSVVRSADMKVGCPWGSARLKFDLVAIVEVPDKYRDSFYLCVNMPCIAWSMEVRAWWLRESDAAATRWRTEGPLELREV